MSKFEDPLTSALLFYLWLLAVPVASLATLGLVSLIAVWIAF